MIANETCAAHGVVDEVALPGRRRGRGAGRGAGRWRGRASSTGSPPTWSGARTRPRARLEAVARARCTDAGLQRARPPRRRRSAAGPRRRAAGLRARRGGHLDPPAPALGVARAPGRPPGARALRPPDHPRGRRPRARERRRPTRTRAARRGRGGAAGCASSTRATTTRRWPSRTAGFRDRPSPGGPAGVWVTDRPPAAGDVGRGVGGVRGRRPRGGRRRRTSARPGARAGASCCRPSCSTATARRSPRATGPSRPRPAVYGLGDASPRRCRSGWSASASAGSPGSAVGSTKLSMVRATSRPFTTRPNLE